MRFYIKYMTVLALARGRNKKERTSGEGDVMS